MEISHYFNHNIQNINNDKSFGNNMKIDNDSGDGDGGGGANCRSIF